MPTEERPVLKPRRVFRDATPAYRARRRRSYVRMALDCARAALGSPRAEIPAPKPFAPHVLSPSFFGMNVCPAPDADGDDAQIAALRELAPGALRTDRSAENPEPASDRFIERLLDAGFPLTVHLVQDPAEASILAESEDARRRWRRALDENLARWGGRIEALEPGSTPNRHSWSGYTIEDYAVATRLAREALDAWALERPGARRPLLLGPNVSDYAPYFTVGLLAACRRAGVVFDAATDNLFGDRVGEPEAWDPHVLGRALRWTHRLNMPRKQRHLAALGRRFGAPQAWCTYTHYTLNFGRERRRYVDEDQYANYMIRMHLLTAAAGAFQRLYWGTLVTHYKGLIDEVERVRPYPPFVHHRFVLDAPSNVWRRRENLIAAYRTMTEWFSGRPFVRRVPTRGDLFVLEFAGDAGPRYAAWTRDGKARRLDPASLPGATGPARLAVDREGRAVEAGGVLRISESPLYWR